MNDIWRSRAPLDRPAMQSKSRTITITLRLLQADEGTGGLAAIWRFVARIAERIAEDGFQSGDLLCLSSRRDAVIFFDKGID